VSVNGPPLPAVNVKGAVSFCGAALPSTASLSPAPNDTVPAARECFVPVPSRTVNGTSDESVSVLRLSASSTRIFETGAGPSVVPG
jgi:hypothetical protein